VLLGTSVAATSTTTAAIVSNLTCGRSYSFDVDAHDAFGNRSNKASVAGSTSQCADTQAPTAPTNVAASTRTATSIALVWHASNDNIGVVGYGLYRGGTLIGSTSSTTGIFSGLQCNSNHTFSVDAYDGAGNRSSRTTVMAATTACPDTSAPSTPIGLAASNITQNGLALSWNASSDNVGVTGYDVFRNGTNVATVASTASNQSGLSCGTSYTFGVVARDAAGNTSPQAQVSASTTPCSTPPPAPTAAPVYTADFETGNFSQVASEQETTPDRITLTTSAPLQGAYTALAKVGPDDYVASGIRAEVAFRNLSTIFNGSSLEGKETWVTWDQRLDPNFELLGWAIVTQFHGGSGSPVFAIHANAASPSGLVAAVRGGPVNGNFRTHVLAATVPLGTHLRFKVYHRWSTGSGGRVQVWLNGVLKATIDGPNLYAGYETAPYQKAGIYRGGGQPTRESQAWFDNVRWWRSDPG
jgi:chitodextrinase